ncbi:MAG: caspase family protein [Caldilinea sp. CFX5]|nr:caspase family protein [Caldilinea sp. CFX5]
MSNTSELYALLVGIDRYDPRSRVPNLRGCVNDVAAIDELLQRTFAVPAANIRQLTNEAATHQAIKLAFRHFLIEKAKAWAQAGRHGPPPAFLFHYSGHGSQARDETGTEPDGMDETLVAHDSRLPGIYDIKDWELGQFIAELNEYSDNVTIILDCCHSGSGTRNVLSAPTDPTMAQTRRCLPDLRPQPPASQRPATLAMTRAINTSNWELGDKHVLLAGCRDKEESNEYALVDGSQRRWHGAMTYFLQRELTQLPPNHALTYRELHERIRQQVNSAYPNQMPQCEGDRDRELFGGLRPQRDAFYTVVAKRDGLIWIDGGVAHGLTSGALLDVYPPTTRTMTAAGAPLARLQVEEEGAVESGCVVVSGDTAVALHARCRLYQLSYSNLQRKVLLAVPDAQVTHAIRQRLGPQQDPNRIDVSTYLRVVEGAADFRVAFQNERLEIQDNSGQLLVAPLAATDLDGLATDLAHLARYHNALELRNTAPHSELAGAIRLTMKELAFDPHTQQPLAQEIQRTSGGELINSDTTRVVWEITNQSSQPLYVTLLGFGWDWSIAQLYPDTAGANEALAPGRQVSLGLSNRRSEQRILQVASGMTERRDRFKVIATVQETNFDTLRQGALKSPFVAKAVAPATDRPLSPLEQILQSAVLGGQRNIYGPPPATTEDEWTTAELEVTTVAAPDRMTRTVTGGVRTALPAFALAVEPPPGFTGSVRMMTAKQSTRAANDTLDLQAPPGLASQPERFVPVSFVATRTAAPGGAFLEIEADDAARQTVTAATPLKLHLNAPAGAAETLFAVAFDGSFYYPVGRSAGDPQTVAVDWLPPSDLPSGDLSPGDTAEVQPLRSTRGVGRVLKLYLYKMIGVTDATLGLRRVRFAPLSEAGEPEADETAVTVPEGVLYYSGVDPEHFGPNERIAVAVHGFSAESKEQARWLCTRPPQTGVHYDHVLTYDYESFNTGIRENGRMLADALRAARLDRIPGLQVDLFAHSMGTVITRCMVELWGGEAFVRRCFLAGPPNGGTRLAEIKKFVPWVTTLALNDVAFWTPAAIGGWALQKLAEDGIAVEDLRPNSPILHDLNTSTKAVTTPYFILAGQNDKPLHLDATAWQRLKHKVLGRVDVAMDALFSDQNDLVIAVKSMVGVRNGQYPAHLLKTAQINCTHFEYFTNEQSQQRLLTWLKE